MPAPGPVRDAPPAEAVPHGDVLVGALLGFVAGFVDAAGFVALSGLFTSHVTGNFVVIGAELVSRSDGVLAKLLALPAFVFGIAATRLIAIALERNGTPPLKPLLLLQAILLLAFLAAGLAQSPSMSPDSAGAIATGMLGVVAMSVQTATARLSLPHLAATTVMTMNVAQVVLDAVDLLRGAQPKGAGQAARRLRRMLPAVLAFGVGALTGAIGVLICSFWCLLVPVLVLIGLVAALRPPGQGRAEASS